MIKFDDSIVIWNKKYLLYFYKKILKVEKNRIQFSIPLFYKKDLQRNLIAKFLIN